MAAPSAWVQRWVHLLRPAGQVLDVACGSGRHARWLAEQGFRVTALDRDRDAVDALRDVAEVVLADIEADAWPLPGRQFDAVLVINYLWRPLWPVLRAALRPGGVLIYETFADGQQLIGKPSRPDFLLRSGELLQAFAGLRVVAFEDGFDEQTPRYVQRLVTIHEVPSTPAAARYPLRAADSSVPAKL